ncbi:MAG: S8 family serine peptidase [Fimbriimonadaceae bacterium]|nr:S8 family serine peptidase [Chitinophagales bacterium]
MRNLFFIATIFICYSAQAQPKYFVYFSDKYGVTFDPFSYFNEKAIERRLRENISLYDISDFPVREDYINSVKQICDSTIHISRWLNGMSIYATEEQIGKIRQLNFVKEIEIIRSEKLINAIGAETNETFTLTKSQISLLKFQTLRHNAEAFRNADLTGKGMRIAVFDVGFPNVDTHPAFENMRKNNRIIATYDFIGNDDDPYHGGSHGTSCLSCIGGMYDSIPMGMAIDAEYLLAKTERNSTEFENEEDAWLAAAEWADKNGADIISSSLAYTKQRYDPADMNGKTSLVSKAAKMASDKGILVINAAGNEADGKWEYLATPADVEEVLTVGGIDPYTDAHINFSSFGPNAEGIMKPNVCSLGEAITADRNNYKNNFGTSFATPLVAGFAACAWQSNKKLTRTELFTAIERSAHLFPYYDYAHGYGIPQANYFTKTEQVRIAPTFTIGEIADDASFIAVHFPLTMYSDSIFTHQPKNLYYHFADADGKIVFFSVIVPESNDYSVVFPAIVMENKKNYFFKAHFERYTFTLHLK